MKQNAIKNDLQASSNLDTLDALMRVLLCGKKVEEYRFGGQYLSYGARRGIGEFLVWTKYCKKLKLLYIYLWKHIIWSSILCERLRFSQPVIWKVVFQIIVCHIERHKNISNMSHEMKVDLPKGSIFAPRPKNLWNGVNLLVNNNKLGVNEFTLRSRSKIWNNEVAL